MQTEDFQTVPLSVAGPSYLSRSIPVSAQRTIHFYPERNKDGISEFILQPWPGRKAFSSGTGIDRGMHIFNSLVYKVTGGTLYEIDAAGTQTSRGTISGTDFCSFADNGTTMFIANGATPYSFAGTTLTSLTAVTWNPKVVGYLNLQFITDGDDGKFYTSDASSTTFNALNTATPESSSDVLVSPFVFNQLLYNVSTTTVEPWDNTGIGNPPFERIDGGIIEDVGATSPYGVAKTPKFMYFVAPDGVAHRVTGFTDEAISPPGVSSQFQTYNIASVKAFTITIDAQRFVVFHFDEATWVFTEALGEDGGGWFELEYQNGNYPVTSYVKHYGKHLVGSGGDVQELDFDTFTDDGGWIGRERILAVIAGETFGKPRFRLEMSKLRISLEAGVGLTTGQGENPLLIVQPSYDGGKTWGQEYWIDCGTLGEHETDVEWHNMAQFKQMAIRLRMTDPVRWTLYGASIDLREAGY